MPFLRGIIFLTALACINLYAGSVFVLANKNSEKSKKLAEDYCKLRSIPKENVVILDVKDSANISREDYDKKIAEKLFKVLKERGAVKDILNSENPKHALVVKSDVDYVVIAKGVPYRISEEKISPDAKISATANNSACVDSELAMLLKGKYELRGMQKNPLFGLNRQRGDYKKENFLAVSRLDGLNFSDALNLANSALSAEEKGLRGRAYIDMSKKYPAGDKWLLSAKKTIEELGFDVSSDEKPQLFNYFDRFDAPAFYFGWYTDMPRYYPQSKDVKYSSGASALHIYSYSAQNLSNPRDWTPSFAARNAAVAFGYINEPFLTFTHRSDIYMHYISRGFEAGEAAFYSMSAFSWKGIMLADPLYSPLKKTLQSQLEDIENGKIDGLSQYAVIRKMNLFLLENGNVRKAIEIAESFIPKLNEKFALNWKLALLYGNLDEEKSIALARESAKEAKENFQNFGLAFEISDFLKSKNLKEESAKLCLEILNSTNDADFLQKVIPVLLKKESFSANEREFLEKKLSNLNKKQN